VEILKVRGYAVRKVRVPFCEDCIALRQAKSPRQVRFERVAVVNSILLALTVGAWAYTSVTSGQLAQGTRGWVWGLLLGVLIGVIVFGTMHLIVRPWSRYFRSSETKAALKAVTVKRFDWETTTLKFENEEYAERFAEVNRVPKEIKSVPTE
jgi:hypothetical protein